MNFNKHYGLEGKHAFLSASQYHWINYSDDKLVERYRTWKAAQRGTKLHEIAATLIEERIPLPRKNQTLNMYVNDGIGFQMTTEQILYFSENCFGTADSISFKKDMLRIHDLKTGTIPAHMEQLKIYAALFCLEYNVRPTEIGIELRIYQNDDKIIEKPEGDEIFVYMEKIISSDKIINELREAE